MKNTKNKNKSNIEKKKNFVDSRNDDWYFTKLGVDPTQDNKFRPFTGYLTTVVILCKIILSLPPDKAHNSIINS